MSTEVYEVLAYAMRYWFALLGLLIVWRAFRWLRKDRQANHRRLRDLPDAGMIGEMAVLAGSRELQPGMTVPVPREGALGYVRTCDVTVPVAGVAREHLYFRYDPGKGLVIEPGFRQVCWIDGVAVTARSSRRRPAVLRHGSVLQVGEAALRMRFFAGLTGEIRPALAGDPGEPAQAIRYGAVPAVPGEEPPADNGGREARP